MKLTVLSEVKSNNNLKSELGLSYYIEHDDTIILFDTGASELYRNNALELGEIPRIDYRTNATIDYLKRISAKQVMPSHCTMEPALSAFYTTFGRNMVKVGQEIVYDS